MKIKKKSMILQSKVAKTCVVLFRNCFDCFFADKSSIWLMKAETTSTSTVEVEALQETQPQIYLKPVRNGRKLPKKAKLRLVLKTQLPVEVSSADLDKRSRS